MATTATPADATARALLDAALRVFVEQGVRSARMEDVAAAAGVSRATLYYHFRSREALLEALVLDGVDGLAGAVTGTIDDGAPVEQVVAAAVRYFAEHAGLVRLLVTELWALPEEPGRLAARLEEAVVGPLAARIAEGVERGELRRCDPRIAAAALIGQVEAVVGSRLLRDEPLTLDVVEPELVAFARAALKAEG
ncbi:MAG: TetR/AcrR family transcriptional regulator [Egibacteraceae bacterium]